MWSVVEQWSSEVIDDVTDDNVVPLNTLAMDCAFLHPFNIPCKPTYTGGKGWCTELVHCKYIARK